MARVSETSPDYRKAFLIVDPDIIRTLSYWTGSQSSATYSLASTGSHKLVSPGMIDDAIYELERELRKVSGNVKKELKNLIADLDAIVSYPEEHSARAAGMDIAEDEYEYYANPWKRFMV